MVTSLRKLVVALDSQCLSFLIDAIDGIDEPTDRIADERKALIRTFFYTESIFYVSKTVALECSRIPNKDRRDLHEHFTRILFHAQLVDHAAKVEARAADLARFHPKCYDCRVLAEAEDMCADVLLTFDRLFEKRLRSASKAVVLATPAKHWTTLGIPKGACPRTAPHHTNPLSNHTWWRW